MEYLGNLFKMRTELESPVQYFLKINNEEIRMNDLIGKEIVIEYQHIINCVKCGRETIKSFAQGYCYPCFKTSPETDPGILRPELDQSHLGISRDMEWAKENSLVDHYVYLANSSGLKVGVTRATQVPTRWIDQGAWQAIKLAQTPHRNLAGQIEVALKEYFADKTNWRKMLKNERDETVDLLEEKERAWELLDDELKEYVIDDDDITYIDYPVEQFPDKVKSLNLDKTDTVTAKLVGIKGQYLIFEDNSVFNVRKHNGYLVKLSVR